MAGIFEIENELIIFDVRNEKIVFNTKNACHMTLSYLQGERDVSGYRKEVLKEQSIKRRFTAMLTLCLLKAESKNLAQNNS